MEFCQNFDFVKKTIEIETKIKIPIEINILESIHQNFDKIRIKFHRNFNFVESKKVTFVETLVSTDYQPPACDK
jgi:hypothetical protein